MRGKAYLVDIPLGALFSFTSKEFYFRIFLAQYFVNECSLQIVEENSQNIYQKIWIIQFCVIRYKLLKMHENRFDDRYSRRVRLQLLLIGNCLLLRILVVRVWLGIMLKNL